MFFIKVTNQNTGKLLCVRRSNARCHLIPAIPYVLFKTQPKMKFRRTQRRLLIISFVSFGSAGFHTLETINKKYVWTLYT